MNPENLTVFSAVHQAQQTNTPIALATVVATHGSMPRHAGSKMAIYADGRIVGTVGGGAMEARVIEAGKQAILDGQARLESYTLNSLTAGDPGVCGGTAQIFVEPLGYPMTVLVIGAGHVGKALAGLAKWLGYRVVLSDDRADLCHPDVVPHLDSYIVCDPATITEQLDIQPHTYIAAVTRGLPVDLKLIPALLKTPSRYIGLIGSQRRWELTRRALLEQGVSDAEVQRIHAPIGLELEAETPNEIAVSILAEMIMVHRGGTGKPMGLVRQP
ncbi:MAG: XdhC family protein [Phototrophicaceae bacterium]